jgi:copper chaperone CopZ
VSDFDPDWEIEMIRSHRLLFLYLVSLSALLVFGSLPGRVLAAEASAAVADAKPSPKVVEIPVDGMACVACAASVKSAVKAIPGVVGVEVSLEKRNARVTYFANPLTPDQIVAAIDKLGYAAGTPKDAP